jgi:hypothetical protein
MRSIGIGEIQKNTSIFANIDETIQIVDKRKNRVLAFVYPVKKESNIKKLAGKYSKRVKKSDLSFDKVKESAYEEAMRKKYGLSS